MVKGSVVILTGATASGKSALALEIAHRSGGMILNGDSMQLYRDAPILTAQPSAEDMASIPHRLYGIRDAASPCSVAQWLCMVTTEIRQCWEQGLLPIVVGGTGMYIRALMHGIATIPPIPDAIRDSIRALPHEAVRAALLREDPIMAAQLLPSDVQRNSRALEVLRATGKSLSVWQQSNTLPLPEATFSLYCTEVEREALYVRINARTHTMLAAGGLQEAEALHARKLPRTLPLLRAVGVAELLNYLDGNATWEETQYTIARNTRRYAKRQLTWMRNQWPKSLDFPNVRQYGAEDIINIREKNGI
jgi:tRNA dimethylallyltransferase